MKGNPWLWVAVILLTAAGCGSEDAEQSPFVGTWRGETSNGVTTIYRFEISSVAGGRVLGRAAISSSENQPTDRSLSGTVRGPEIDLTLTPDPGVQAILVRYVGRLSADERTIIGMLLGEEDSFELVLTRQKRTGGIYGSLGSGHLPLRVYATFIQKTTLSYYTSKLGAVTPSVWTCNTGKDQDVGRVKRITRPTFVAKRSGLDV